MKIAIINLTGGDLSGGYRRYIINTIPGFSLNNNIEEILVAYPENLAIETWFKNLKNVRFVPFCQKMLGNNRDIEIRTALKSFRPDIIFIPTERHFKFDSIPVVNMLLNMEPYVDSFFRTPLFTVLRNIIRRIIGSEALKKADRVIAVSHFVKEHMLEKILIDEKKIDFIPLGIDMNYCPEPVKPEWIPQDWEGRFIFTVGSVFPYRGFEDVICAMNRISRKDQVKGLVIVGDAIPALKNYKRYLRNEVEKSDSNSNILWYPSVSEQELAWCYSKSRIFIMTSRLEAFPITGLEALSYGCVIIAADNPPLPEVFADIAVYYPPGDFKALASLVDNVLDWDCEYVDSAKQRARSRAKEFSWDKTVADTVDVLLKAIGEEGK